MFMTLGCMHRPRGLTVSSVRLACAACDFAASVLFLIYALHFFEAPLAGPLSLRSLRASAPAVAGGGAPAPATGGGGGGVGDVAAPSPLVALAGGPPVAPVVKGAAVERVLSAGRLADLRALPSVAAATAWAAGGTARVGAAEATAWLTAWSHWRASACIALVV